MTVNILKAAVSIVVIIQISGYVSTSLNRLSNMSLCPKEHCNNTIVRSLIMSSSTFYGS